jgi:hypothetical protein
MASVVSEYTIETVRELSDEFRNCLEEVWRSSLGYHCGLEFGATWVQVIIELIERCNEIYRESRKVNPNSEIVEKFCFSGHFIGIPTTSLETADLVFQMTVDRLNITVTPK